MLFGDNDKLESFGADPVEALEFYWMRLDKQALVAPADIPATQSRIAPCFGAIYRTHDFPADCDRLARYRRPWQIALIEGTKIGGVPFWIQGPEPLPGRFLCVLGSIQPAFRRPYPFLNRAAPIEDYQGLFRDNYLSWGDAGSLYLFLERRGQVHAALQCY